MINAQTIKTALTSSAKLLNTEEAVLESQLLLQHVLNVNRAWLIAHENDAIEPNIHKAFEALLERRLKGEPIAYILGYREFYGLKLKVTPDTLIPRPDTETLVEAALEKIPQGHNTFSLSFPRKRENESKESNMKPSFEERPSMLDLDKKMDSHFRGNDEISHLSENSELLRILDLGTGTGAIALALAHSHPQVQVTACDASEAALQVARENAQTLNIPNVPFVRSDWFAALMNEKFDLIVSNPPYIEADDPHLSQGDLRFEPLSALAAGNDGLDDIRKIVQHAPAHLNARGWLLVEHGYNQADAVANLLAAEGFSEISHALDLAGIHRVTLGRLAH